MGFRTPRRSTGVPPVERSHAPLGRVLLVQILADELADLGVEEAEMDQAVAEAEGIKQFQA